MNNKILYTCMWCWFRVFEDILYESEICPICNWQDSSWWMLNPYISPYVWYDETLYDNYQQEILKKIPYKIKEYKKWKKVYIRNNLWKPIDKDKLDKNYDYFPKWKFDEFFIKWLKYDWFYIKLFQEAQKYNPDERVHLDC
jgi:hypothetical protein